MKRFLLLLALAAPLAARAATPSFDSFVTNEFIIARYPTTPWKIALNLNTNQFSTNGSGIGDYNVSMTNINNINLTNDVVSTTNLYVSYINGVPVTNIIQGLWTNYLGNYFPTEPQTLLTATGVTSYQLLDAEGSLILGHTGNVIATPGTNDVSPFYQGFITVTSDVNTTNAADRILTLSAGTALGQLLIVKNWTNGVITNSAFTIVNGSTNADGTQITFPNGDWAPTHAGESVLLQYWADGWSQVARWVGPAGGQGNDLWISTNGVYQQVFITQPVDIESSITWGSDLTHLLYRSSNSLVYSNASPSLLVLGPSGQVLLSENSGVGALSTTESDLVLQAGASREIHLNSTTISLTPDVSGQAGFIEGIKFGDDSHRWTNGWFDGTLYVNGLEAGIATNYSRLAISHSGTNSTSSIDFDSQSSGTAGEARNFAFRSNSVLVATMDLTGLRFIVTNSVTGDYGFIGAGSGTFDVLSGQNDINIGNSTKSFHMAGNQILPNSLDIELGGSGVEFFKTWTEIVKLRGITKAQKSALFPLDDGMLVYQTDNTPGLRAYVNGAWVIISTAADP